MVFKIKTVIFYITEIMSVKLEYFQNHSYFNIATRWQRNNYDHVCSTGQIARKGQLRSRLQHGSNSKNVQKPNLTH